MREPVRLGPGGGCLCWRLVWCIMLAAYGLRIGEAANPGPSAFDVPCPDGWFDECDRDCGVLVHGADVDAQGLGEAATPPVRRQVQRLLGAPPAFLLADRFDGARHGMVFKCGTLGTGYYADSPPQCVAPLVGQAPRVLLDLAELVPERGGVDWGGARAVASPHVAAGQRLSRRRRAAMAGDPRSVCWDADVHFDDARYKEWGLWALVTTNITAWNSADALLRRTAADAMLLQEHHLAGPDRCRAAEQANVARRWRLSLQPALATVAGGTSAGVGIGVARHTGLSHCAVFPSGDAIAHRVQIRHWGGVCKGGVHLACVYLHDREGLSRRNLDLLQELAFALRCLRGPWICAGDFNLTVSELEQANWFQLVDGVAVVPEGPTCGERVIVFSLRRVSSGHQSSLFSAWRVRASRRIVLYASSWTASVETPWCGW